LKSSRHWNRQRIIDAGYSSMDSAIRTDRTPNLLVMQCSVEWRVQNLLLVPRVLFLEAAVEKRKPLGPKARRCGWVGCNILLSEIPRDGRIGIVCDGVASPPDDVRVRFNELRPFQMLKPPERGWTLSVYKLLQEMNKRSFRLSELSEREFPGEVLSEKPEYPSEDETATSNTTRFGFREISRRGSLRNPLFRSLAALGMTRTGSPGSGSLREQNQPGLKPGVLMALSARLKPCPSTEAQPPSLRSG